MTRNLPRSLVALAFLSSATGAAAQYKYADPDGRITYSDRPPPASARILAEKRPADSSAATALPFELQQAASKFPVVLYSGNRCAPCDEARAYLKGRGVPFAEKTVSTDDDIAAFRRESPEGTAPVVTVGTRRAIGFSQPALATLLDNAGYPATSQLPRDWQAAVPTPLAPRAAPAAPSTAAPRPAAAPPATPAPTAAPPGFRF